MVKTVCVVGAGPAGIIAAKTLLHEFPKGSFDVTVFEKTRDIGGLWPTSPDDKTRINPELRTNLSRHTVSFSDLAWPEDSATFPKAWHVGQYLKRYLDAYPIPKLKTGCNVIKAVRKLDGWTVDVASADSTTTHEFDHLIVASGFFGSPKVPDGLPGLAELRESGIPVIHSLNFQQLPDLLASSTSKNHQSNIVIVGGQMSGAETAASVALQVSSVVNSPGLELIKNATRFKVHQVVKRPFWVLPTYMPTTPTLDSSETFNPATPFLPIDLVMYDLSRRPPGDIRNQSGHITEPAAEAINSYLQRSIGGDQSSLGSGLAIRDDVRKLAPRVAIADRYAEFVRSGAIEVHTGSVSSYSDRFEGNPDLVRNAITLADGCVIKDVAAVIMATGFDAQGSLSYLPADVLQTLEHDANCTDIPLILDFSSTFNRKIPNLGFVGFYRGPFWGVMEMQSRFLGKLWTNDEHVSQQVLAAEESSLTKLRDLYHNHRERLAQFPMGDYIYLMESMADWIEIGSPDGSPFRPRNVPAIPSLYLLPTASKQSQEQSTLARTIAFHSIIEAAEKGKFVSRAVFSGLQGDWNLHRTLRSVLPTHPSGTFTGRASFYPRFPTGGEGEYDAEYLYIEEGDFKTDTGMTFRANRRYVYRYSDKTDLLSAWFVKTDDNKAVDYLFHEVEVLPPKAGSGWRAKSYHLCIKDHYNVQYEFRFKGASVDTFSLGYSVKGPQKDYRIESSYTR